MLPTSSISCNEETIEALSLTLRRLPPLATAIAVSPDRSEVLSSASSANGFGVSANGSKVEYTAAGAANGEYPMMSAGSTAPWFMSLDRRGAYGGGATHCASDGDLDTISGTNPSPKS